jgi:WD40 repeat protein
LASASYDDTIKIWKDDDDEWICAATLVGHTSTIWGIDFNQDGTHLVSVSDDLTLKIWKRTAVSGLQEQWECIQTIENQHQRTIYSVSWCKDTQFGLIATGCGDNCIRVFAPIADSSFDESPVYELTNRIPEAHGYGDINCVEWEPAKFQSNGKYLASAGDDGNVKIWELSH